MCSKHCAMATYVPLSCVDCTYVRTYVPALQVAVPCVLNGVSPVYCAERRNQLYPSNHLQAFGEGRSLYRDC